MSESGINATSAGYGWDCVPLGELLEPDGLSYGVVQPGSADPDGVPMLRVKNIRNGRIVMDDVVRIGRDVERSFGRTRLRGGELLLSLVGSVGETAIAPAAVAGWNVARAIGVLRPSPKASAKWIQLCLDSRHVQHHMLSWRNETVQATLNLADVRRLPILLPPPHVRSAITELVTALDDKITINERIATAGQDLLQSNYQRLRETSDQVFRIDQMGRQAGAAVDPKSLNGNVPYIGLEHMPQRSIWLWPTENSSKVSSTKSSFLEGDVLFGKLRPYFHKVGLAPVAGICSTDILVVRATAELIQLWLLMTLASDEVVAYATARSEGTKMPRTKWSDLASYEVGVPNDETLGRFNELARPLIARVQNAQLESADLATLRDTLLPRLMSGELRIRDAERVVSGAV